MRDGSVQQGVKRGGPCRRNLAGWQWHTKTIFSLPPLQLLPFRKDRRACWQAYFLASSTSFSIMVHSQFQLAFLLQPQFRYRIERGELSLHHEASVHALSNPFKFTAPVAHHASFAAAGRPYQSRAPNGIPVPYKRYSPFAHPLARSSGSTQHCSDVSAI